MPLTLADIREDILDHINRPQDESGERVDRAIRKTIKFLQRKRQFVMAERMVRLTYPANSLTIDVTSVLDGKLRDLISVQRISSITATSGLVLKFYKYSELMAKLNKFQRRQAIPPEHELETLSDYQNYERAGQDFVVFFLGGNIGLYPTPSNDVHLLLGAHVWLNDLEDDDDTNFFLDYCEDYIVLKTLYTLNTLLKVESRNQINAVEVQEALDSVFAWDSQIASYPGETI